MLLRNRSEPHPHRSPSQPEPSWKASVKRLLERVLDLLSACSPLADMELTRTDREREARGADRVVLLLSADVAGAAAARATIGAQAQRIEEAAGREGRAATEDEEAAATRDCWASPRMSQSREKREPRGEGRGTRVQKERATKKSLLLEIVNSASWRNEKIRCFFFFFCKFFLFQVLSFYSTNP